MIKKIIFVLLFYFPLVHAYFDMTMDRISTTDIPPEITQLYYRPHNPTRCVENFPARKNRWARCNKKSLRLEEPPCQ